MSEILSPGWETEIKEQYSGPYKRDSFNWSFFGRHQLADTSLRKYIGLLPRSQNVLYIGIGLDNGGNPDKPLSTCASGPFEVAATLEGLGKVDYRMTILDLNRTALEAARSRNLIFYNADGKDRCNVWKKYLKRTSQYDLVIPGDKIHLARIPNLFKEKKRTGEIRFVQGDIVTANLYNYGPFDLIHCFNILCHLRDSNDNIILALYNMIRNLDDGGVLVVDNKHGYNGNYCTNTRHKIENIMADQISLCVEEELLCTRKYSYLFVRKLK